MRTTITNHNNNAAAGGGGHGHGHGGISSSSSIRPLTRALSQCPNLTSLNLQHCNLLPQDGAALRDDVLLLAALYTTHHDHSHGPPPPPPPPPPRLQTLVLSLNHDLGDEGVGYVMEGIGNSKGGTGTGMREMGLRGHRVLLRRLELEYTDMSRMGAHALTEAIWGDGLIHLEHLNIGDNAIGDEGMKTLIDAMAAYGR